MTKRIIAALLVISMAFTLLPMTAMAAESEATAPASQSTPGPPADGENNTVPTDNENKTAPTDGESENVPTDGEGEGVHTPVTSKAATSTADEPVECDHWYEWKHENGNHWKKCNQCGDEKEMGSHYFVYDVTAVPGVHIKKCNVCGWEKERGAHTFEEQIITEKQPTCTEPGVARKANVCSTCGWQEKLEDGIEIPATGHSYWWKHEGNEHYKECSNCGDTKERSEHYFYYDVESEPGVHIKKCSVCGLEKERGDHYFYYDVEAEPGMHIKKCDTCGWEKERGEHYFYYDVESEPGMHIKKCSTCGWEKERGEHTFVTETDPTNPNVEITKCSTCGWQVPNGDSGVETNENTDCDHYYAWKHDDAGNHWKECTLCGNTKEEGQHYFYYDVESEPGMHIKKCSTCGWEKERGDHYFYYDVEAEPGMHIKKCDTCGWEKERGEHYFYYDVESEPGMHIKKCSTCGWEKERGEHYFYYDVESEPGMHIKKCDTCGWEKERGEHYFYYDVESEPGMHIKKCSTCGWEKERGEHYFYYDVESEPGMHIKKCSTCGWEKERGEHDYGEETVIPYEGEDSTCSEFGRGRRVRVCGTCGWQLLLEDNVQIPKKEHTYDGFWSVSDGANGEHWHECTVCHEKADVSAHDYGAEKIIPYEGEDSTCSEFGRGRKVRECATCGWQWLLEDNVQVPKKEHTYDGFWSVSDGANGEHWHECTVCHEKADVSAHDYGAEKIIPYEGEDSTCSEFGRGRKVRECATCGWQWLLEDNVQVPKKEHSYESIWHISDGENGEHWHECAVCHEKTDVGAHIWGEYIVTKKATYWHKGEKTRTCGVCDASETVEIPKLTYRNDGKWDNPKTGDYIMIAVGVMVLAAVGLVGTAVYGASKKRKK